MCTWTKDGEYKPVIVEGGARKRKPRGALYRAEDEEWEQQVSAIRTC